MDKKELLINYIKWNVAPILVDFINGIDLPNSIVLNANCDKNELNGQYFETQFTPPKWFTQLKEISNSAILIIDKIDTISKNEQTKFVEILKYRKISTFSLPKDIIIILTANEISKNTINEEIYSLVVHIGD